MKSEKFRHLRILKVYQQTSNLSNIMDESKSKEQNECKNDQAADDTEESCDENIDNVLLNIFKDPVLHPVTVLVDADPSPERQAGQFGHSYCLLEDSSDLTEAYWYTGPDIA